MIGRGAIGNPWIFGRQDRDELLFCEITNAIRIHLNEMLAYHGDPHGMILFRKHLKRYLKDLPSTDPVCRKMVIAETIPEFENLLTALEVEFSGYSVHSLAQRDEIQYLWS
jgi:tRNA-dihydrouridine synthase